MFRFANEYNHVLKLVWDPVFGPQKINNRNTIFILGGQKRVTVIHFHMLIPTKMMKNH